MDHSERRQSLKTHLKRNCSIVRPGQHKHNTCTGSVSSAQSIHQFLIAVLLFTRKIKDKIGYGSQTSKSAGTPPDNSIFWEMFQLLQFDSEAFRIPQLRYQLLVFDGIQNRFNSQFTWGKEGSTVGALVAWFAVSVSTGVGCKRWSDEETNAKYSLKVCCSLAAF